MGNLKTKLETGVGQLITQSMGDKQLSIVMIKHIDIEDVELRDRIKRKEVVCGGNLKLKIYGTLHCKSGKRMKRENRVFFNFIQKAIELGFRPCGNCLHAEYKIWKDGLV